MGPWNKKPRFGELTSLKTGQNFRSLIQEQQEIENVNKQKIKNKKIITEDFIDLSDNDDNNNIDVQMMEVDIHDDENLHFNKKKKIEMAGYEDDEILSVKLMTDRKGHIRQIVRTICLQENYPCGVEECSSCLSSCSTIKRNALAQERVIVIDSDLAEEVDFLWDDECINNVVIFQTTMNEVRVHNRRAYTRLRELARASLPQEDNFRSENSSCGIVTTKWKMPSKGERRHEVPLGRRFYVYPNEVIKQTCLYNRYADIKTETESERSSNIRAISVAALWLTDHLKQTFDISVLFLSADQEALKLVSSLGVLVQSVENYLSSCADKYPTAGSKLSSRLLPTEQMHKMSEDDISLTELSSPTSTNILFDNLNETLSAKGITVETQKRSARYPAHFSALQIRKGLRNGSILQGRLRMTPNSCTFGYVAVGHPVTEELQVRGWLDLNRAVDGDIVAIKVVSGAATAGDDSFQDVTTKIEEPMDDDNDNLEARAEIIKNLKSISEDVEMSTSPAFEKKSNDKMKPDENITTHSTAVYSSLQVTRRAVVVGIVKRQWRTYCGTLRPLEDTERISKSGFLRQDRVFVSANARIPHVVVRVRAANDLDHKRLVVAIDSWDRMSRWPKGHWLDVLGEYGDETTENKIILHEHEVITSEFSTAVLRCLPPTEIEFEIPFSEYASRIDLRLKNCFCDECRCKRLSIPHPQTAVAEWAGTPCAFEKSKTLPLPLSDWENDKMNIQDSDMTDIYNQRIMDPWFEEPEDILDDGRIRRGTICCAIDPPTCVDIDDALSIRRLDNGHYELGVHIADVSRFVSPGTALDEEAALRCTTVYLQKVRTDMLPKMLTADLCSLRGCRDRLTFSIFWEVDEHGSIFDTKFAKTVIHSVAGLSYDQAQAMIDDSNNQSPLKVRLVLLDKLAKIFRERRFLKGALELSSNEAKFTFDDDGNPVKVEAYVHKDVHRLVEEFMLLANMTVASKIVESFPSVSVLRRHPPPKAEALAALAEMVKGEGFDFQYDSSSVLSESLRTCVKPEDPLFNKFLKTLTTRAMNQAVYSCSGDVVDPSMRSHYGLAVTLYTHFTSPIRRYADILVHRLLAASLGLYPLPDYMRIKTSITDICERLTERHRNARFCSDASQQLTTYMLFKARGDQIAYGMCYDVRKNGCGVYVPSFAVDGVMETSEEFRFDAEKKHRVSSTTGDVIKPFTGVFVKIEAVDTNFRLKTKFEFVKLATEEDTKAVVKELLASMTS